MQHCCAIKVKIGLRPNGHADHPDWTSMPLAGPVGIPLRCIIQNNYFDNTGGTDVVRGTCSTTDSRHDNPGHP